MSHADTPTSPPVVTRHVAGLRQTVTISLPGRIHGMTRGQAVALATDILRAALPAPACQCGHEYVPDGSDLGDSCAADADATLPRPIAVGVDR